MSVTRRTLLATATPALLFGPQLVAGTARAATDPRMSVRAAGNPAARVHVEEWFSLTCTHCARFASEVFPEVRTKLIDTGKVYYIFRDFPLDQIALMAAMVARTLPPERYEPFVLSLLSSQDRWAFAHDINPQDELQKMAALAGMPADLFQKTVADDTLRQAIMDEENRAQALYKIEGTPTFRFNDKVQIGQEMTYDAFAQQVASAT
ncbi:DsbA family protein [Gluconacetobacter azotocaptans]|uniref:DsbA family protein n=1 Tax=Gluconacetobacter azotocaptans TaxID=142834 RepID=A0A7W4JTQ8_9PROT|nr:thioredoxin domain-containing protein [Gluconacetobacter azotocaptans]MBB2190729.1 DsbA family protein [Gluconacetobacter azotocaptans]MBM9400875.1 DsbA family protein [Gluconacetobacter azotocaptans]GBQ33243.1 thiol:disulfide interchange protein [Gluconacetobacter azotocaptans DSM 13594]